MGLNMMVMVSVMSDPIMILTALHASEVTRPTESQYCPGLDRTPTEDEQLRYCMDCGIANFPSSPSDVVGV